MNEKSPAQIFGLVFGAVYVLVGILGFFVTGFEAFAENANRKLIIFEVNPLHNIVHLLIGGALLAGSRTHPSAKSMNMVVGVTYLGVAVIGIFGVLTFLDIDEGLTSDFWLHLFTGILAVYFGTAGAGGRTTSAS